ncbi:MAG: hypothetical protein K0R05_4754 [Anaerocolumna sp.]|nr:hypothetical protein [Anaerocolumna sp.]
MNNYCINCGEPLAGGNFCSNCGKPITNQNNNENTEYREPSQRILKAGINEYQLDKKNSAPGKSLFIFLFIILCAILISIILRNIVPNINLTSISESTPSSTSMESNDLKYITLDEYTSIKNGMTYEEVVKLIGSEGTSMSESSAGNISIKIISWYGNGLDGSNANVTFTNDKVTGKAQIGLN